MTLAGSQNDLCIWVGPITSQNLAPTEWAHPTDVLTLNCVGSDACATIGYNLPRAGMLRALLKAKGKSMDGYAKVILASFSAGHGLADLMLQDAESRDRISAVCACDSYYTGQGPALKKGYYAFSKMAAAGDKMAWFSVSSFPGSGYISSGDAIKPLLDAIKPEADSLPGDLSDHLKAPLYCVRQSGFAAAAFGSGYKHVEHATVVAPAVLGGWISPTLHAMLPMGTLARLGLAAGAAAGLVGIFWLGRLIARM